MFDKYVEAQETKTENYNTKNCFSKWGKSITLHSKTINKYAPFFSFALDYATEL